MSLVTHSLIKFKEPPALIRGDITAFSKTTPWNLTLGATPTEGALMMVVMGSDQDRDYTISGWSHVNYGGLSGNMHVFAKIAGAGESTTVNIGWTTGGNGDGTAMYYEISGSRSDDPIHTVVPVSSASATTHQYGSHMVPAGVFEIQLNHKGIGLQTWAINDGYTIYTATSTRTNSAFKRYGFGGVAVNPTWTYNTAAVAAMIYIHVFGH